jgi:hypothetical protein
MPTPMPDVITKKRTPRRTPSTGVIKRDRDGADESGDTDSIVRRKSQLPRDPATVSALEDYAKTTEHHLTWN